jgi:hypothetical protein
MWGRSHVGPNFRDYENRTADSGHRASDLTPKSLTPSERFEWKYKPEGDP